MMAQTMAVDAMQATAHSAVPGARVQVGSDLGLMRDGMTSSQRDLIHGEIIALPVLLLALVFIFGPEMSVLITGKPLVTATEAARQPGRLRCRR